MSSLPQNVPSAVELALVRNDISKLTSDEKISYLNALCKSVGLNPLTKPFAYLTLQGREVVYATKDCSEQLRKIHGVSTQIVSQQVVDGCFEVQIKAQDRTGRTDEDFASIPIGSIKGSDLSNLKMKCITKAKRRVTLSICGLGVLDESELDTIDKSLIQPAHNPQIENPLKEVKELREQKAIEQKAESKTEVTTKDPGKYVVTFGKFNNRTIESIDQFELNNYLDYIVRSSKEKGKEITGQVKDFLDHAEEYLIRSEQKRSGSEDIPF